MWIVVFMIVALGCGASATPAPASAPAARSTDPAESSVEQSSLPAGLYFREGHYDWRCEGCADPTWMAAAGPFETGAEASAAVERLRGAGLPPGYPWAVHSNDVEAHDAALAGVFVVAGMFTQQEPAVALAHRSAGLEAHRLASRQVALERLYARLGGDESTDPVLVTQIDEGHPVRAYPHALVERILNLDELDGRGERSALVRQYLPEGGHHRPAVVDAAIDRALQDQRFTCELPPGSVHVATRSTEAFTGLAFARVDCDGQPAFVRWLDTRRMSVVHRVEGEGYRLVQPRFIECDRAYHEEWAYDAAGRRPLPADTLAMVDTPSGC